MEIGWRLVRGWLEVGCRLVGGCLEVGLKVELEVGFRVGLIVRFIFMYLEFGLEVRG